MNKQILKMCSMLVGLGLSASVWAGNVVVIVNKDNNNAIDKHLVTKIYKGEAKLWESGGAIEALSLKQDNPETEDFCKEILGKRLIQMKLVWSQMMFSGQGVPPKELASDADVKKAVSNNVNAIGFIKASDLDDTVKAVIK